jgi:hypothetical protein
MTIDWLNPAALAGLAAVAGPLVIHLLRRQRAPRLLFPTIQFFDSSRAAAVRLRSVSNPWLLLLRIAVIILAVLAAAQPGVVTAWRRGTYDARTSRVLLVDTSASMAANERAREEAVAAERGPSGEVPQLRAPRIGAALPQAVGVLQGGPPARHEIVVFSDFQHGSISAADIAALPAGVGLRFVTIGERAAAAPMPELPALGVAGTGVQERVRFEGPRTVISLVPAIGDGAGAPRLIVRPASPLADEAAQLLRVVARAGAPGLSPNRSLTVYFPGTALPSAQPPRAGWMVQAFVQARDDAALQESARTTSVDGAEALSDVWIPVARASSGTILVAMAASNGGLAACIATPPSALFSAVAVRALLVAVASSASPSWEESEVERIPAWQLAAWSRAPRPLPPERATPPPPGDARWFWAGSLLLLLIESLVRRTRRAAPQEHARAA